MDDVSLSTTHNQILGALPADVLERLRPNLEYVELPLGKVLYGVEENIQHIYFPERAMISVVGWTIDGRGSEVAVIGREGATGVSALLGSGESYFEYFTQIADGATRIALGPAMEEFARCGPLHDALLRFTSKMVIQISQVALCNRLHTTDMRLSRWLLMCHDRAGKDTLHVTQEFLSIMLGANRTTVTMTAIALQESGFISYKRGKITILDRPAMEAFACDCYRVISTAYENN
jgi:CRP-like cAMP-binding protein